MDTSIDQTIRHRIATERVARGWSCARLAKKVSAAGVPMDIATPWRIEHEDYDASLQELAAIARVFEIPMEDLLEGSSMPMLPQRHVHMLARGLFEVMGEDDEVFNQDWVDWAEDLSIYVREIAQELHAKPDLLVVPDHNSSSEPMPHAS